MKVLYLFMLLLIVNLCNGRADYSETRTLNLSAQGINDFEIDCGAGSLEIVGIEGAKEIVVKAEITFAVGA